MGISRQIILLLGFALLMMVGITALLVHSSSSASLDNQRLIGELQEQYGELLEVIDLTSQTQVNVQKLIRERDIDNMEKLIKQIDEFIAKAKLSIVDAKAKGTDLDESFDKLIGVDRRVMEIVLKGDFGAAMQLFIEEANPAYEKVFASINGHKQKMGDRISAQIKENKEAEGASRTMTISVVVVGIVVMVVFGWLFRRNIMRKLKSISEELRGSAQNIKDNVSVLADASSDLNTRNCEQAAAVEETSASMEEMTSMTNRNAENADRAKDLAESSRESVEKGSEQVAQINLSVEKIQNSAAQMKSAMTEIEDSSHSISKVLKNINEIAFQTNLLALNAAVEAARAGEAGMGFAVVADEVRALAKRCADSSLETNRLVDASIQKSHKGSETLLHVTSDLDLIIQQVSSFDKVLKEVDEHAKHLSHAVVEIAQACQEQNQGANQINKSISYIDKATQSNAAQSQEVAKAAENFNEQASQLNGAVTQLMKIIGDSRSERYLGERKSPLLESSRRLPARPQLLPLAQKQNGNHVN